MNRGAAIPQLDSPPRQTFQSAPRRLSATGSTIAWRRPPQPGSPEPTRAYSRGCANR